MRQGSAPARYGPSLRTRFLLVLVLGAVLPLALIGAWLVRSSGRAGETLLRTQLEESLTAEATRLRERWRLVNGDVLLLAENDVAWRLLDGPDSASAELPRYLLTAFETSHPGILRATWTSAAGTVSFSLPEDPGGRRPESLAGTRDVSGVTPEAGLDPPLPPPPGNAAANRVAARPLGVPVEIPIRNPSGRTVGYMQAELSVAALLQPEQPVGSSDAWFAALDARTGAPLVGPSMPPEAHASGRFTWNERTWIGVARTLDSPPLELRMAAPLEPIVAPFARAARTGGAALLLVSLLVVLVTTYLTTRITRSVLEATHAAEAIAAGDLEHQLPVTRSDEVGRLARALNAMGASLRGTLDALARQRTLAALGEFATSLAHEVRNAHTAVGVDLQRALEQSRDRPDLNVLIGRSLRRVRTVDRIVDGALSIARSGRVESRVVDLNRAIEDAARATQPWFAEREARLDVDLPHAPVTLLGDSAALETLFVNLLRNAAQALPPRGQAALSVALDGRGVEVLIEDDGQGMSPEQLEAAFTPFVTTREGGTGLGLAIARQIAYAHGGDIEVTSALGEGTRVKVRLARG